MFSILWIIVYVVSFSFGDNISETIGIPKLITLIIGILLTIILVNWMRKNNLLKKININVLNRISEIEYVPTDVIKNRFLLLMNDGNYVYITLDKFKSINKYIDIIKEFEGKKGILYLDSGKYFDVLENEIT